MSTRELGEPSPDENSRSGRHDRSSADAPFSDMISRWLDEGDRLSESGRISSAGPTTQQKERRLAELFGTLRAKADRHRVVFVFCAVAMSAIAVAAMRALSHAVLTADPTAAAALLPPRAQLPPRAIAAGPAQMAPAPASASAPTPAPAQVAPAPEPVADPPAAAVPVVAAAPVAAAPVAAAPPVAPPVAAAPVAAAPPVAPPVAAAPVAAAPPVAPPVAAAPTVAVAAAADPPVATAPPAPVAAPPAPAADPPAAVAPITDPPMSAAVAPAPAVAARALALARAPAIAPAADPPMSAAVAPSARVAVPAADRLAPARPTVAEATAGRASREATRPQPSERPIASSRSPLQVCEAALRRERVKDALVACEQVATANPTSANAVVLLAHADLLAGRDGETLRLARRASTLDPRCAEAYLLIGNVQQAAGRKPDARIAYEAYLHAAPRGFHAAEVRAILRSL